MRKRSAYRPKPVHLNALERAVQRAAKLSPEDRANLMAIVDRARDEFVRQVDARANWKSLADCFNVAETLAELGICSDDESMQAIGDAHEVLGRVWTSQAAGGSWALFASEIAQLDAAILRHRIQLEHCSLGEWERASQMVARRTQQALAGNAAPGVSVYGAQT